MVERPRGNNLCGLDWLLPYHTRAGLTNPSLKEVMSQFAKKRMVAPASGRL